MKNLYISYGPPASGKSRIKDYLENRFHEKITEINIDTLIEQDEEYKNRINQFLSEIDLNNVGENEIRQSSLIYFEFRKKYDNISTNNLKEAIQRGDNIIYETTGRNMEWFITNDLPLLKGYRITIVYPIVNENNLKNRALVRGRESGRFIDENVLRFNFQEAQLNFIAMIQLIKKFDYIIFNNNFEDIENFNIDDNIIISKINDIVSKCKKFNFDENDHFKKMNEFFAEKCGGCELRSFILYIIIGIIILLVLFSIRKYINNYTTNNSY